MWEQKTCEACGTIKHLTKHHVYPRALREVWRGTITQRIVLLCRLCHDVVHLRGGRTAARQCLNREQYIRRLCDPRTRETIGYYRAVIRQLERKSREKHGS